MKIYHGSIEKVANPEIRESNRTLDYGRGFYTTTSYEQAESWVRRRMGEKKVSLGYVCVQKGFVHEYDLVYGPVANDKVYAAFALYEGGLIDKTTLISELKTYVLVDQYLFHTSEALEYIKFVEAKEIVL